jgi:hypothetical protein
MAITQKFAARTGDKASDINRRINQKVKLFLSVVAKFFFKLFDDKFLSLFFLFSPCSVFVFAAQVKVFSDRGKITRALPLQRQPKTLSRSWLRAEISSTAWPR